MVATTGAEWARAIDVHQSGTCKCAAAIRVVDLSLIELLFMRLYLCGGRNESINGVLIYVGPYESAITFHSPAGSYNPCMVNMQYNTGLLTRYS